MNGTVNSFTVMRFSSRSAALSVAVLLIVSACTDSTADTEAADLNAESSGTATTTTATFRTGPTVDDTVPDEFAALDLEQKIDSFLEASNSRLASNIAADMALDGDSRWGPWLLDLLRLGPSNLTDENVAEALATISGIERSPDNFVNDDYRIYGGWVYDEAAEPGPGYREWKLGLYGPIDPDYDALLGSVSDDVTLGRIQWGGVPRGGIPELNDPVRVPAAEADWMEPDETVFGAVVAGKPVAYPFRILGHRELANDRIGGVPVALVFCTLCRTALLFDRRVERPGSEDIVVDLQTSGLLANSNKIMVDVQTDTLWSHLEGVGIGGPLEGVELNQLPLETTTWGEWRDAHPTTETLALPDPIFPENPEQGGPFYAYEPDSPYPSYYDNPDVWFPILDTPTDDIELKDEVVGLRSGDDTLAVAVVAVVAEGPRVFQVGDATILLVPNGSAGARAYDATGTGLADGDRPTVEANTDEAVLADGTATAGSTVLPRLTADQGFWFAWFGNNPETDWWPRQG